MRTFYPAIEPYASGMLDVGQGHRLYWETSGNPAGKPAVFLHGGPGGATSPGHRRVFDPARYRIVLVDQRGCGRSTPHAGSTQAALEANTTWHLVDDLEVLREHLSIESWLVFGGAWGSTLALAYAQKHPTRVTELVLRSVLMLSDSELAWIYRDGASALFPDRWEHFIEPVFDRGLKDPIEAYHALLSHPDPAIHERAGLAWTAWEAATINLLPKKQVPKPFTEPDYALAFARIENHFFRHRGWFEPEQLLRAIERLRLIPTVIVQGRYDVRTPPNTAWKLHSAWPEADLRIIPDAGHAGDEPGVLDALIEATDRFASTESNSPRA